MLIFIIPAYNEEDNLKMLLENTRSFAETNNYRYQIIVINDGSTDGTMQVLKDFKEKMPLVILDQGRNKGPGEAFKRGFAYAAERADDEDIIISKEADNTSDLSILPQMLNKIDLGNDIALASCYMSGGSVKGTNLYRRILSKGANFLLRFLTSLKGIHTFSSFYRAYRARLIKRAYKVYGDRLIQDKGFSCMTELLLKLSKLNIRIAEVPMVLDGGFRSGKSKKKTLKTIVAYSRLIAKNLLNK